MYFYYLPTYGKPAHMCSKDFLMINSTFAKMM